MEYAFEGTTLTSDHEVQPSVFTSAVVHGLQTGEADRDEDGLVSLGELYDYVFDRVREQNPRQTPGRDVEMPGRSTWPTTGGGACTPRPSPLTWRLHSRATTCSRGSERCTGRGCCGPT